MAPLDVLNELIKSYQEKGLGLDKVLQDPLFLRMTVPQKVAAIKKYGEIIQSGAKFDKEEWQHLLLTIGRGIGTAALAAATLAYPAYRAYQFYKKDSPIISPPEDPLIPGSPTRDLNPYYAAMISGMGMASLKVIPKIKNEKASLNALKENAATRSVIKNTNFKDMSDEDAVKFLATLSQLPLRRL